MPKFMVTLTGATSMGSIVSVQHRPPKGRHPQLASLINLESAKRNAKATIRLSLTMPHERAKRL